MNNKSPVKWLIEQLQAPCRGIPSHIIEEAQQMEYELMKNEYLEGYAVGYNNALNAIEFEIAKRKQNK